MAWKRTCCETSARVLDEEPKLRLTRCERPCLEEATFTKHRRFGHRNVFTPSLNTFIVLLETLAAKGVHECIMKELQGDGC